MSKFTYFGVTVSNFNRITDEIQKIVVRGNRAYYVRQKPFTLLLISWNANLKLCKTLMRPLVTYAAKTWTAFNVDVNALDDLKQKYSDEFMDVCVWRPRIKEKLRLCYKMMV